MRWHVDLVLVVACLLLLIVSSAIYLYETVVLYAQYAQWSGLATIIEVVGNLCRNPASLLTILIGVASIELCWLRWRRRAEHVDWIIRPIDRRGFAWNWAALALFAIVGIPTLSSFCFVYWLGPWQLYAP